MKVAGVFLAVTDHVKSNNMKNKIKFWIIAIALIVVITNLPPINYFLQQSYSYRNEDNSFTYTEESGKGLDYQAGIINLSSIINR